MILPFLLIPSILEELSWVASVKTARGILNIFIIEGVFIR